METHRQIDEDRSARLEDNRRLEQLLEESEKDRAARVEATQRLEQLLKESEEDRAARLEVIHQLAADLEVLKRSIWIRLLLKLGLVKGLRKPSQPEGETGEEES